MRIACSRMCGESVRAVLLCAELVRDAPPADVGRRSGVGLCVLVGCDRAALQVVEWVQVL